MTAAFRPTLTSRTASASTMLARKWNPMFILRLTVRRCGLIPSDLQNMVGYPKKMHRHRNGEVCKDKSNEHKKDKTSLGESSQGFCVSFFVL
jgi:hypothetical protein